LFRENKFFANRFEWARLEDGHGVPCPYRRCGRVSLVFTEAVEEHEEEYADDGVDGSADGEVHGEPRFGLCEQEAAGQDDDALVDAEENYGEGEAGDGVFGVEAGADG
jgi:hypothetical protein